MADAAAFDAFYASTRQRLLRQLTLMTADRDQSQDALQEAFVRAWQRWDRVGGLDDPEGWVRTVAWRLSVSRWRRWKVSMAAQPRMASADAVDAVASEDVLDVRAALARLPVEQRRVLVLHELCDLSVEAVAAEVGVPVGTVKTRLMRGRHALAAMLATAEGEVPGVRPS